MLLKMLVIFSLFVSVAMATENAMTNGSVAPVEKSVASDEVKTEYTTNNGNSGGALSTVQSAVRLMEIMYGNSIYTKNRGDVASDSVKIAKNSKKSMNSFNKQLRDAISLDAVTNSKISLSKSSNQLKCYIARDIPFEYKCSKTGLVYGGDVGVSGKQALDKCRNDCYEQNQCLNAEDFTSNEDINKTSDKIDFSDANQTNIINYTVQSDRKVDRISFKADFEKKNGKDVDSKKHIFINLYVTERGENEKLIIKKLRVSSTDLESGFYIDAFLTKIKIEFYNKDNIGFYVKPTFTIHYRGKNKWFCPSFQDLTNVSYKNFSKRCPGGKLTTVHSGNTSSLICSNGEKAGDNEDGTFSNRNTCNSVCRVAFQCVSTEEIKSLDQLKNYKEGCIAGQGDCKDTDCKNARINNLPILNEIVFDANMKPRITVQNGSQIDGEERPRISDKETSDFEKNNIQEWKDKAYLDMVKNNRYVKTKQIIKENTERTSSYSFSVGNNGEHQLLWNLKPRAFDVTDSDSFYFYAVLEVDYEYWAFNSDGKNQQFRDKVFYIKTGLNKKFKPFARFKRYGSVSIDGRGVPTVSKNQYSKMKYQTFSGRSWINLSKNEDAPYFMHKKFGAPDFFYSEKIIDDMEKYNYYLPGMIRSSKETNQHITYNYTGFFDGTGDNIAKTAVHVFYSKTKLKYFDVYQGILNEEEKDADPRIDDNVFFKIYDSGFDKKSIHFLESDSEQSQKESINIYRYGKISKTSAFFSIKVPNVFVGQKGFIYVFLY